MEPGKGWQKPDKLENFDGGSVRFPVCLETGSDRCPSCHTAVGSKKLGKHWRASGFCSRKIGEVYHPCCLSAECFRIDKKTKLFVSYVPQGNVEGYAMREHMRNVHKCE